MTLVTLTLGEMAHGGSVVGHEPNGRPVFVPFAIPGEKVQVSLIKGKGRYTEAHLEKILQPSPQRVPPRCLHFGTCGGCHFQHIDYSLQLKTKEAVVRDQLQRIGHLQQPPVRPTLPHPQPWGYRADIELSPTPEGELGFWSPALRQVIPIESCPILQPRLREVWQDIDLVLPGLRKLTLRLGADEEVLAALEVDDMEPPELETDFPISVAIVLPDKTAASLIGEPYLVKEVKGRPFRVSPGCFFHPSPLMAGVLVDIMLEYAGLTGQETVVEAYSGVGTLTAFLAQAAQEVVAIEANEDAVTDTAVNLDEFDNVVLYQGFVEEVLPLLTRKADCLVVNPAKTGLAATAVAAILALAPPKIIYLSSEIATLARDSQQLTQAGYQLQAAQPVDMLPQTFHIDTVSLWQK